MKSFKDFVLLMEADPAMAGGLGAAPAGGGAPPMGGMDASGGMGGGMPSMGGSPGLDMGGGGMPGMGGGGDMGMGGGDIQAPAAGEIDVNELNPIDVWKILDRLLQGKPASKPGHKDKSNVESPSSPPKDSALQGMPPL